MRIPAKITAGDTVTWRDHETHDALRNPIFSPDWVLTYEIRGSSNLTVTGSPYGSSGWETTISSAASALLNAGVYFWQAYATGPGPVRITLGSGQLHVAPNLSTISQNFDGRSQLEKDLSAVQAAMRAIVSGGAVQEYSIAGRSVRKYSLPDLMALESKLKSELFRSKKDEMIKNGLGNPQTALVRFRK